MNKKIVILAISLTTTLFNSASYALDSRMKVGTLLKGITTTDLVSEQSDKDQPLVIDIPGTGCIVKAEGRLYMTGRIHLGINEMVCKKETKRLSTKIYGYAYSSQTEESGFISECMTYHKKSINPFCLKAKLNAKTPLLIQLTQAALLK